MFTNVYNSLVDPKAFCDDSFVDIKADHCVVPLNWVSYQLADGQKELAGSLGRASGCR